MSCVAGCNVAIVVNHNIRILGGIIHLLEVLIFVDTLGLTIAFAPFFFRNVKVRLDRVGHVAVAGNDNERMVPAHVTQFAL